MAEGGACPDSQVATSHALASAVRTRRRATRHRSLRLYRGQKFVATNRACHMSAAPGATLVAASSVRLCRRPHAPAGPMSMTLIHPPRQCGGAPPTAMTSPRHLRARQPLGPLHCHTSARHQRTRGRAHRARCQGGSCVAGAFLARGQRQHSRSSVARRRSFQAPGSTTPPCRRVSRAANSTPRIRPLSGTASSGSRECCRPQAPIRGSARGRSLGSRAHRAGISCRREGA